MPGRREAIITGDTFIRVLPYSVVKYISSMLDIDNRWERLVVKIPRKIQELGKPNAEPRYSSLQVRLFGNIGNRHDGSPTQAILDDWSTQNTKLKHLITVLCDAYLYEAADYLSVNVLHGQKVLRNLSSGACQQLPSPEWEPDNKPKNNQSPISPNMNVKDAYMKSSEGEKLGGTSSVPYDTLSDQKTDAPYNKLEPEIIYNRIPSYDHEPSIPLKGSNTPNGMMEKEETTFESASTIQIRKVNDESDRSEGPVENTEYQFKEEETKNKLENTVVKVNREPVISESTVPEKIKIREPIEVDEVSQGALSCDTSDIYSMIGSQEINYDLLQMITAEFNTETLGKGGRLIGSGGFGEVFLGKFKNGYSVAVKRLKKAEEVEEIEKQFRTELDSLITYRHKNIVRLYGYSVDGPGKCLVYEYLCNGSLEDRLKRIGKTPPLLNSTRVSILQGTADGITFLNNQGIIHRDIKSANVLLDADFAPKVGDFATARGGPRGNNTMAMSTQVVIGTSAYLAPEALHFDVSTKLDSYSFGIVILEVVTGLPPLDTEREERDLKGHVEENEIWDLLDTSGGDWSPKTVEKFLEISGKCTQHTKKRRCNVEDILSDLHGIVLDCQV